MLEVVERDERVREHQRQVGQPDRIRVRRAQRLDGAHAVVAEEADGAAGERRQAGDRRLAVALDLVRRQRVRVAPVGEHPAHDAPRPVADERPAADALALLGRLEQEGGAGAAQLQERGDGRLAVLQVGLDHRHEVVAPLGERADLLQARRHPAAARTQRRRARSTS